MTEEEKLEFIKYLDLKEEFTKAAARGVLLLSGGRYVTPDEAAKACAFGGVEFHMSPSSYLFID